MKILTNAASCHFFGGQTHLLLDFGKLHLLFTDGHIHVTGVGGGSAGSCPLFYLHKEGHFEGR